MQIRKTESNEEATIEEVVSIHLAAFQGFFLTFLGRGFLRQMYRSYCEYNQSGLLVAFDENKQPIGFIAYSGDISGLYRYMLKKKLMPFAWYSLGAFLRKPKVFMRLIRAFIKPSETRREVSYVELASIGVKSDLKSKGVGSQLINRLIETVDFSKYAYITLETDAIDNNDVNCFYQKNGFVLKREFETHEGRKMNEYRFGGNL